MGCRRLTYYPNLSELKVVGSKKELTPKNSSQNLRSNNLYRYCGKEKDSESGLYYYGARYYAPWTCRFISTDPKSSAAPNLTPYHYTSNNPINRIDPDGMQDKESGGGQGNNTTTQNTQVHSVKRGDTFIGDDGKEYTASIDEVEVTGAKPITAEAAARIADNVYGGPDAAKLIDGWQKSDLQVPGVKFNNDDTGFQSALYERTNAEGVTEYAYAFAGTNDLKDAKEDAAQALGKDSPQYEQAARNARILSRELGDSNLTFVGHSLGGGLASAAALATGRNAITFNAAGLHQNTKDTNQLNMEDGTIDAFIIQGEFVDYTQRSLGLSTAEGTRHEIKASYVPQIPITGIDDKVRTIQRIHNHLMGTVIQKMQQQGIR